MRKTPVVLGVLSIVFSSLMILGVLVSFVMAPFMRSMTAQGPMANNLAVQASQAVLEAQQSYQHASSAVFFVMSLALLIIGIGLSRRRPWARQAGIAWGAAALLVLVALTVTYFGWQMARAQQVRAAFYAAHGSTAPAESGRDATFFVAAQLFDAIFPIVLLALLGRRSAEGDFPATPAPPAS